MNRIRLAARLLRVFAHLLWGLCVCALVFPCLSQAQRLARIRRWSGHLLDIFGVSVSLAPASACAENGLWVANHVSWIDIFVVNALFPSRFVAKSEVRRWPLVGALCAWAGTIFIERANPRALRRTMAVMVAALGYGERVVVFPEGTSAAQGAMLPFRANLFESAIEAAVLVQPISVRYLDAQGRHHGAVEYIGATSLVESMVAILSGGPIQACLSILPAFAVDGSDRRTVAQRAHQSVAEELAGQATRFTARPKDV
jgi:1-acyl-sn-glycerol-3-phosphate acyltransferase